MTHARPWPVLVRELEAMYGVCVEHARPVKYIHVNAHFYKELRLAFQRDVGFPRTEEIDGQLFTLFSLFSTPIAPLKTGNQEVLAVEITYEPQPQEAP